MAYPEFPALLISDEVARREQKRFATRLRRAAFRTQKTLDQFDFNFNPTINSALIHELVTGRFIEEKVAVLIAGPCGTGKSHIAQAIGHAAVRQGHDVLFTSQSQLLGAAILDRLRHGAYRVVLDGKSYRSPRPLDNPLEKQPKSGK